MAGMDTDGGRDAVAAVVLEASLRKVSGWDGRVKILEVERDAGMLVE